VQKAEGLTFVHPFDDPDVIAGQGTVAMEILRQHQGPLDAVFVAIGGGGLISGVAAYIKAVRPEVKVIGVQTADSDAMLRSVKAGKRVQLTTWACSADGTAVKLVGEETFRVARQLVDDYVVVDTDEVCAAIKDIFQDTRSIMEPSGAMGVAGIKQYVAPAQAQGPDLRGRDLRRQHELRPPALRGRARRVRRAARGPVRGDHPRGARLVQALLRTDRPALGDRVQLPHLGREGGACLRRPDDQQARRGRQASSGSFVRHGFATVNLTDDELAKEHVRHMVGGHSELAQDERLFRFVFPERPGALMRFLAALHPGWNISLFHYRNQGADYGRILVGIQVPAGDEARPSTTSCAPGLPARGRDEQPGLPPVPALRRADCVD
jgi:threonine dehydratase